jgi:uncharacterized protein YjiS (DUF1127 family)
VCAGAAICTLHSHTNTYTKEKKMTNVILTVSNWLNFGFIINAYMSVVRAIERRAHIRSTIRELNKLTDRELDDMGICRGMIDDIAKGVHQRA